MNQSSIVQMDRHRKGALRFFLADDIALQFIVEISGTGNLIESSRRRFGEFFGTLLWIGMNDDVTQVDTVCTDVETGRPGDQTRGLVRFLAAETATFLA